jgi:hypothetical protein
MCRIVQDVHKFNERRNCVCVIMWDGLNCWNYIVMGCLYNVDELDLIFNLYNN